MSAIGTGTLSLRKQNISQEYKAATAYRSLSFAHKATAGATGVDLTALVQPSEMASLGFTNPSTADILAAEIFFYKRNLTVVSSVRGILMQDLSYTVPSSQRINFEGFTALEGEIFTFKMDTGVKDGLTVVDASPIVATGQLIAGSTDFNVGIPFTVNSNPGSQIGSVLVFRNGVLQFRNPSNGTTGGNYSEVDNGSGLGTIIRFNNAPLTVSDNIVAWGSQLAERPDGSMRASIETLAGQIDKMVPTLAAVAGVPTTTFQPAPNSQDLKAFGDKVLSLMFPPNPDLGADTVISWQQGIIYRNNISGNKAYTFTNVIDGMSIVLVVKNTIASTITLTFPPVIKNLDFQYTVLSNRTNVYTFLSSGGQIYATAALDMQ